MKKCVGDDVMLAESRRWCKLLVNRVCRTLMLNTKPMLSEDAPMGVLNQGRVIVGMRKNADYSTL